MGTELKSKFEANDVLRLVDGWEKIADRLDQERSGSENCGNSSELIQQYGLRNNSVIFASGLAGGIGIELVECNREDESFDSIYSDCLELAEPRIGDRLSLNRDWLEVMETKYKNDVEGKEDRVWDFIRLLGESVRTTYVVVETHFGEILDITVAVDGEDARCKLTSECFRLLGDDEK